MTAVANDVFTAAQFNTHVRDNLLETAPAKATTAGSFFVTDQANSIGERIPTTSIVNANESTTSTTYADLTTAGPTVTVNTGANAIVWFASSLGTSSGAGLAIQASVAVSGSTTIAADDNWQIRSDIASGDFIRYGAMHMFTTLTPGSNTFTMKYKVPAATTGNFNQRELVVLPL